MLIVDRGLDKGFPKVEGRDVDYATLREKHKDASVPVAWLESSEPSYILYTSGTTGKPKGVQRDTGGYAVALASSMKHIMDGGEGETLFATSDIGWVVGHSYIVYGPLLAGMATIMYEGTPLRPDAGIWWQIVEKYKVSVMFSAPTAVRVLKKQDPAFLKKYDLSSLKHLFLAGEPLDETSHEWIMKELGMPVIDNYWQTETGWPMLAICRGVEESKIKLGSPAFPVYGYDLRLFREDGSEAGANEKAIVGVVPPLPPGCLSTVWGQDERFVSTYFSTFHRPESSTLRPTGESATTKGTTPSSAAWTTSSTWPAIASARERSKKPCSRTRRLPRSLWSVSPISSRARCRWPLRW